MFEFLDYSRDVWERSILFWDTLRRRADNMLEHERAGLPPLLDFKYEMISDARRSERPANYALLRILEIGDACWEDCVDPNKPPVIVIDSRAGHGPGIGGFKRDSEVGTALHEGHPVYFVIFFPEPCPGQTLADVLNALRHFVEEVSARHPGKPPILYGNCQAGWAVALLAAECQGLTGPTVLNGSPLSYWAGESGINPARTAGGLLGGVWMTRFLGDLGNGRSDGAWLAQNFEYLKPGNAVWDKYANLFASIDTERERFLEFERWWGGFLSDEHAYRPSRHFRLGERCAAGAPGDPRQPHGHPGARARALRDEDRQSDRRSRLPQAAVQGALRGTPSRGTAAVRSSRKDIRARPASLGDERYVLSGLRQPLGSHDGEPLDSRGHEMAASDAK
jgi:Protein of unknown function (DUF3141)